jgi:hypothetical protein
MSVTRQDGAVRLLSRRDLADRWSFSIETLKRRERCGLLPFLKLGRGVRYRLADVEEIEAEAEVRQSGARTPLNTAKMGSTARAIGLLAPSREALAA